MCHCPLEWIKKISHISRQNKEWKKNARETLFNGELRVRFLVTPKVSFRRANCCSRRGSESSNIKRWTRRFTLRRIIGMSLFTQTCYFRHIFTVCIIWSFQCNLFFSLLPFVKLDTFNFYLIYSSFVVHLSNIFVGNHSESDLFN